MIDNLTVYELFRNSNFFGVCETAGATADKEVQIADFELAAGVTAMVKFKYSNTATSPTLNISNTGAIPICGEEPGAEVRWEEWDVIPFTYDGTYWQMTSNPGVKVDQIPISTSASDYRVLLGKTADNEQHLEEVYKANNFRYTPDNYELIVDDGLESSGTDYVHNMDMIMDATHKFAPAQTGSEVFVIGGDDYYRISCSSGSEDNMRAQVVYRYELSHITRKVRYKLEVRDSMASDPEGLFAIYVGFRDEYDETNFVTPDQFVISKSYSAQNTTIEDELDLSSVGSGYIYILANSWNLDLLKFEEVSYDEKPHMLKGYLSNNSSGVIYNDNGFERSIVSSVSRNNHPELTLSYNNMYMMKNGLTISDNDIVLSGIDNTWDGSNTSLKTAVGNIYNKMPNLIKAQTIDFPVTYFGQNMNLDADGVNWKVSDHIDTGYKFLCWQVCGSTDFIIEAPICITNPLVKAGNPIWDTPSSVPANGRVKFTFFEILDL